MAAPASPTDVIAGAGDTMVELTWTPPTDGEPIDSYAIYSAEGDPLIDTDSDPTDARATITGLTNGTSYSFVVTAVNTDGESDPSTPSNDVTPAGRPAAPTDVDAEAGDTEAVLSWTVPDDNGAAITDYVVEYSDDNGLSWNLFADSVSTDTSVTVTGLTNGTPYLFQVAAVNSVDTGDYSLPSSAVTPAGRPAAPTDVDAEAGDTEAVLSWTVPDDNGAAIIDYVVEYSDDNGVSWNLFDDSISTDTSVTVTGLTNGTPYLFQVAAVNSVDTGDYSLPSSAVTPSALPATPTITDAASTGVAGEGGMVQLGWTDLQSTNSKIDSYVVQFRVADSYWQTYGESPTNSFIVDSLTDGTAYTFRVAAKTVYGRQGAWSDESTAVTPSPAPSAAVGVTAVALDRQAMVTWTTDADGFGWTIDYYVIQLSTDGGTNWTEYATTEPFTASGALLDNLTNGSSYIFRVAAVNEFGRQGEFSDASEAVTPLGVPDMPANFFAQSSDRSVKLTWSDPADAGGLPITGYNLEYRRIDIVRGNPVPGKWITVTKQPTRNGSNLALTITGLVNGAGYEFNAVTKTGAGDVNFESDDVASAVVMPLAPVTGVVARAAAGIAGSPASVSIGWIAPRLPAGVAVVDYVIQYSSDAGKNWQTYDDGVSRANVTRLSLVNGNTYVFKVAAVAGLTGNLAVLLPLQQQGDFSAASAPVTPFVRTALAAIPSGLMGESVGAGVRLSWTAPAANQGGAAARYVVQYKLDIPNAKWIQATLPASAMTSAVIGRLGAGKSYSFRVAAVNMAGQSAWSDVLSGVLA